MPEALSVADLFKVAIGVEKRGAAFYDIMARSTNENLIRGAFEGLANLEKGHLRVFEDLLARSATPGSASSKAASSDGYIRALLENAVFTEDMAESDTAAGVSTDLDALDLAIGAEKDSIIFYYELADRLQESAGAALQKIIAEEKEHLSRLSAVREQIMVARSVDE